MTDFPRKLMPVEGPFPAAKVRGAAAGMGDYGDVTRAVVAQGNLQPDLITGMTLALLARQPRKSPADGEKKASGVAGKVWVREQFTIHRPIAHDDAWQVEGESTGTYVKKGRSYSTTASRSQTSQGERFATNLTTGLFSYRPDPDLADSVQGLPLDETPSPDPDWDAAQHNPHLDLLRTLKVGDVFGGDRVLVSLAMMAARDTANPDNPIHSDPEQAKKAGLGRPIAGGSHVLSFALEPVMAGLGTQVLLHGAHFDIRWKAPTEDGINIMATATVTGVDAYRVVMDLNVDLEDGRTAMVGTLTIPLP
jgi:acyl dehydratase